VTGDPKQAAGLWIRLVKCHALVMREVRRRVAQGDTTLPQFDVMAALARQDVGMNMTELSRMLMVSNGNVTGIIDRLAAEKLVLRQAPASDRRSFIVRLTPKGAAQFAAVARAHEGWIDELLSEFDATEAEALIGHLGSLTKGIHGEGSQS